MSATLVLAGQRLTTSVLNANTPGPWQQATLKNSWVNTGGSNANVQYRLLNSTTIEVMGICGSGTLTGGTVFFTMGSGFVPATVQVGVGIIITGTGQGNSFEVIVHTNGDVLIGSTITAGATQVALNMLFSLDA